MTLVIGSDGILGSALVLELGECHVTSRRNRPGAIQYDLMDDPEVLPKADISYLCAAVPRFIDCETFPESYRVNVDAPIAIARLCLQRCTRMVFFSSDAVGKALHTAYGMHKALAEMGLAGFPNVMTIRLPRLTAENLKPICRQIITMPFRPLVII